MAAIAAATLRLNPPRALRFSIVSRSASKTHLASEAADIAVGHLVPAGPAEVRTFFNVSPISKALRPSRYSSWPSHQSPSASAEAQSEAKFVPTITPFCGIVLLVIRTFIHSFEPATTSPVVGPTVDLTTEQIEDAGIKEVLQTPGAALGTWALLDALLEPTGDRTPFLFREPLGQAREVKVALSGLFGRFVARAYLERYFGLSIFSHLAPRALTLNGPLRVQVVRVARGDLPDWIACAADFSRLTIAEAKGCHDWNGPQAALDRAWKQAKRVDVVAGSRRVTVKRIAIATRWGAARGGAADARLAAHDPEEDGEPITPDAKDALFIGLLRLHIAGLLGQIGHVGLAGSLRNLVSARSSVDEHRAIMLTRQALDAAPTVEVSAGPQPTAIDALIGGVVTRAGWLGDVDLPTGDQEALSRLNLRPVFVGVERAVLSAAVEGDADLARSRLSAIVRADSVARADRSGAWIIPLGQDRHISRTT